MKKHLLLTAVIALAIVVTQVSASGAGEAGEVGAGPQPVRYVVPGNEWPDTQLVADEISSQLQADGINANFQPTYIPWESWEQRVNLMVSTGEEFEMIHGMENHYPNTTLFAARDAIIPLDNLIEEYGQNLQQVIPDWAWDAARRVDGQIYSVPAMWIELASVEGWVTMRKDLLDKYGLEVPETLDEIIETADQLQEEIESETGELWYGHHHPLNPGDIINRTADSWPFTVIADEELAMIMQDGTVRSWVESDEFKRVADFHRALYERDLLHPDLLSLPSDVLRNETSRGRFLFRMARSFAEFPGMQVNVPEIELAHIKTAPEKGDFQSAALANVNAVSSTTDHPELAVQFLDWVYSSQDNHDLLLYGIEGTHWNDLGGRLMERVDPANDRYLFDFWQIAHMEYLRFQPNDLPQRIEVEATPNPDAETSVVLGFTFDATPVRTQYANLRSEFQAVVTPIKLGVVPYEEGIGQAIERMKAAGLDMVLEEYQRQVDAFLSGE